MPKKLNANFFVYSANDLLNGHVLFFSEEKGWIKSFLEAKKISKDDLETFERKMSNELNTNEIINPYPVELNDDGSVKKLREKIRINGLSLKEENV